MFTKWNAILVILDIAWATSAARGDLFLHLDAAAPGPNPALEWQDLSGKNSPFTMVGPNSVTYDDANNAYTFSGMRGVSEGFFQSAGADEANFDFEELEASSIIIVQDDLASSTLNDEPLRIGGLPRGDGTFKTFDGSIGFIEIWSGILPQGMTPAEYSEFRWKNGAPARGANPGPPSPELLLHLDAAEPGTDPSSRWHDLSGKNNPFDMVGQDSVIYDDAGDAYTFSGTRGVSDGFFESVGADEEHFDFEGLPGSAVPFTVVAYFRLNNPAPPVSQPLALVGKLQPSQQGWFIAPYEDDGFDRFDVVGQGDGGNRWYYRDQTAPNTKWGDGTDWHLAVVAVDGGGHGDGVKVYLDGSIVPLGITTDAEPFTLAAYFRLNNPAPPVSQPLALMGKLQSSQQGWFIAPYEDDGFDRFDVVAQGGGGDRWYYRDQSNSNTHWGDGSDWHLAVVAVDGSGRAGGVAVYLDGSATPLGNTVIVQDNLASSTLNDEPLRVGGLPRFDGTFKTFDGSIGFIEVWSGNSPKGMTPAAYSQSRWNNGFPDRAGVVVSNHPPRAVATSVPPRVALRNGAAEVTLDGSASEDGDGGTQGLAYSWQKVSGPAGDVISDAAQAVTRVTFTQIGEYIYRLTVDDRQATNNTASAAVRIAVLPEGPNPIPGLLLHLDAAAPGANPPLEWQDLSGNNLPFRMVGPGSVNYDDAAEAYTFSGVRGASDGFFTSTGGDEMNFDFEELPGSAVPFTVTAFFRLNNPEPPVDQPLALMGKLRQSQQGWFLAPFEGDGFDRFDVVGQGVGGDRWYYRDQTDPNTHWGDGIDWHLAVVAVDGSGLADGVKVYLDGGIEPLSNTVIVQDDLASSTLNDEPLRVGGSPRDDGTFSIFDGSIGFIEIWSGNLVQGLTPAEYSEVRWNNGVPLRAGTAGPRQIPGDCNQDNQVDQSDAVCLLSFLFLGGPPQKLPCDGGKETDPGNFKLLNFNGDLNVDISDAIALLIWKFLGGPPHPLGANCVSIAGCPNQCAP
ncbi:MAG: hypothetical protein HY717_00495 [Planctomycetes bacterium]|nr:hypothetical protein [Planctomycetota bacterium]